MCNKENLFKLENRLQELKQSFQAEAIYSEDQLNELQRVARLRHQRTEEFFVSGVRLLVILLQDKLSTGWTYEDNEAACIAFPNTPNIVIRLVKPSDILETEYAALEISVKENYLTSIDAAKVRLLPEIALTQLCIKDVQKLIAQETKDQSAFEKELAKVELELLGANELTNNNTENK